MLKIAPRLSYDEIVAAHRACRDGREKSRWNLLRLMTRPEDPLNLPAAADAAGIGDSAARRFVRRFNEIGRDALRDGRAGNGPRLLLSAAQLEELHAALRAEPPDGGLWTSPKVALFSKERFGVTVTAKTGWVWLRKLGFTPKVPRPTHPQAATDEERRRWKRRRRRPDDPPS